MTTVGFDIFVTESLLPLVNGMKIVLANEEQSKTQAKLNALLKLTPADVIQTTPTKLKALIANDRELDYIKNIKTIILGGEALDVLLIEDLKKITNADIFNIYGPTETTVWATNAKIEDNITIGKPIANTQIYIVDKYMKICPIGVTGELCIAGDGVGAGYLNRPELTAEKFIDNPFGKGKLYKTGDLAYWREDGNIAYVGRNDFQVKIRGLRIELGEIENAINSVDGISQSVVVIRKDEAGRQLICAFYTGEEKPAKEIRDTIGKRLPKYMLPHIFTHIVEMPLTSSGKLNRKALPEIDLENIETTVEFVEPKNEAERNLVDSVKAVLNCEKVSTLDNFFDVGGDSLKAIELVSQLESRGYEVQVKTIFEFGTIQELAKKLSVAEKGRENFDYSGDIPATDAQMRVYTAQSMNSDSTTYNVPYAFEVEDVNIDRLQNAVNKLIARHESLRTHFENKDGKIIQIIDETADCRVERLKSDDIADFIRPFDLSKSPLLRIGAYGNIVMTDMHVVFGDKKAELLPIPITTSKYDFTFNIMPRKNDVVIMAEYCTELYKETTVKRFILGFKQVLEQLLADNKLIENISVISPEEQQKLLYTFNDTAVEYPKDKCVHQLFEEQVKRTPDKTAIIFKDTLLSYFELNELVQKYADILVSLGINKGNVVAVHLERSHRLIVLQLAVLKIGAIFLPVDKRYPIDRIEYMCKDCNVSILVSDDSDDRHIKANVITIDEFEQAVPNKKASTVNNSGICYIIYTSGSTGTPKGCALTGKGLTNFCRNNNTLETLKNRENNVFACVNSVSFDYFIAESLLPLTNGYTTVIFDDNESTIQDEFLKIVSENAVNVVMTTPTRLKIYFSDKSDCNVLKQLTCVCTSGEPLMPELLMQIYEKSPNAQVYNPIGPSECSVWDIGGRLNKDDGIDIHIGKGRVGGFLPLVRHGDDVVKFFVLDFQPAGNGAVDNCFQLRINGVEIDGAGQHQYIGVDHFLQDLRHVVLVHTFAAVVTAVVAGGTGMDFLIFYTDFFYLVARLLCATGKFVT